VVLFDNLVEDFPPDQVRSVVAHELGHVAGRDLLRGLLWLALVAPAGTFLAQELAERFGLGAGGARPGPAAVPALALSIALVSFGFGVAGNVLSRKVEARADVYALDLTRDTEAFIALERRLALSNVSDPDPPELLHDIFGTHPTTLERIGIGKAWARRRR
jgi:Zn-dependent protease with chaperone function